ncbi:DUF2793 domain-containing protein [Paracoccus aurantiacus]|uniref:DUF2793 domain-containing protein n=1 Tax=Paracoccus aurantiacus TaxID=2599412 RepID=A0A5C6S8P0_9RHOB|nr:DUF2793 domain-containing protein [Paracoccus aurantiacus]TXB70897.1 DUF2793 domain-containing protein [Paracoccus aurantiacus]
MSDQATSRLELPLVQAAQAQKHVTVNESLARLDGLVNLVLISSTQSSPPATVVDGVCYAVPTGATGDWLGQGGKIAIAVNGGWVFSDAHSGMQAFIKDQGAEAIFDGDIWVAGAITLGRFGSALVARTDEMEVELSPGASVTTNLYIPTAAMVIGATGRVTATITGSLTSWKMGTAGALDRFGSGLGVQQGSWARGMLSQPFTYWNPAPVILSAVGGDFATGAVRLSVHWLELTLPR